MPRGPCRCGGSATAFLEYEFSPWYPGRTVKESLLNVLVFLLVFAAMVVVFVGTYGLGLALIPGGRGLIFANPYAGALLPSLLIALVVALYRSSRRPGMRLVTWLGLAASFFLLLTLPLPWLQQMPPVRSIDDTPLVPGRFLALEGGATLLSQGNAAAVIPTEGELMRVARLAEYDALNQRFVLSTGDVLALGATGPERRYYEYTPTLASFQTDLFAVYSVLRDHSQLPLLFWAQAWSVTWLVLGLGLVFSIRTWPLVHLILVVVLARLGLVFLVYAFWTLPPLLELWVPGASWLHDWGPVILVNVAAATLFFMGLVSPPAKEVTE